MPSTSDFYDQLVQANQRLATLHNDLDQVKSSVDSVHAAVDTVNNTLTAGFSQLVTVGTYTNEALYQNSKQNETIICVLEHISKQTCELVNQATAQTRLQETIEHSTKALEELYEATHAQAALQRQNEQNLRRQIEECCPPEKPTPPCKYERCREPKSLPEPPQVGPGPIE
jgi:uncharacterized phage infection (PIP) family protein YhgE